jgi:hypothetical protein
LKWKKVFGQPSLSPTVGLDNQGLMHGPAAQSAMICTYQQLLPLSQSTHPFASIGTIFKPIIFVTEANSFRGNYVEVQAVHSLVKG